MDITTTNIQEALVNLSCLLPFCDYYSIDFEMTGINVPELAPKSTSPSTRFLSTPKQNYPEIKASAEKYNIFQIGIALFFKPGTIVPNSSKATKNPKYSENKVKLSYDEEIKPLWEKFDDFVKNDSIDEAIKYVDDLLKSYLTKSEEISGKLKTGSDGKIHLRTDEKYIEDIKAFSSHTECFKLISFLSFMKSKLAKHKTCPTPSSWKTFSEEYPMVPLEGSQDGSSYTARAFSLYLLPNKELDNREINLDPETVEFLQKNGMNLNTWRREGLPYVSRQYALTDQLKAIKSLNKEDHEVSFLVPPFYFNPAAKEYCANAIFDMLIGSKKQLIIQNGLKDLSFYISTLHGGKLPDDYEVYKKVVNTMFSTIFDTRTLCILDIFSYESTRSGLQQQYKEMRSSFGNSVNVETPFNSLILSAHNATSDAIMSGVIFLYVCKGLERKRSCPVSTFTNVVPIYASIFSVKFDSEKDVILEKGPVVHLFASCRLFKSQSAITDVFRSNDLPGMIMMRIIGNVDEALFFINYNKSHQQDTTRDKIYNIGRQLKRKFPQMELTILPIEEVIKKNQDSLGYFQYPSNY